MNNMDLTSLLLGTGTLAGIELASYIATSLTRNKFQWMITSGRDKCPKIDPQEIKAKYFGEKGGFDTELGWVRKPNTSGKDRIFCELKEGEWGYRESTWNINSRGARRNPGYEHLDDKVLSLYGDSFTFARQVNDNETWENVLSQGANINALNFGVGNYGLDQALLRLEREFPKNPTKVVVIGTVADTICRVLSVWKQFYEYGNIWAFKPRFELDKQGQLKQIKNPIDSPEKFTELPRYMGEIRNHDFFARFKFDKDLMRFPYSLSIARNPKKNLRMIYNVLVHQTLAEIFSQKAREAEPADWNAARDMRKGYLELTAEIYQNKDAVRLMHALIGKFSEQGKRLGFHPVFAFLPQKNEVKYNQGKDPFYMPFFREASERIDTIDVTTPLLQSGDIDSLYNEKTDYGAHYSPKGNKLVGKVIHQELKGRKLI